MKISWELLLFHIPLGGKNYRNSFISSFYNSKVVAQMQKETGRKGL